MSSDLSTAKAAFRWCQINYRRHRRGSGCRSGSHRRRRCRRRLLELASKTNRLIQLLLVCSLLCSDHVNVDLSVSAEQRTRAVSNLALECTGPVFQRFIADCNGGDGGSSQTVSVQCASSIDDQCTRVATSRASMHAQ